MTTVHNEIKTLSLIAGASGSEWAGQISTYSVNNGTGDPERFWAFGGPADTDAQSFTVAADDEWSLSFTAYADWSTTGISKYAYDNDGEIVSVTLIHLPGNATQSVTVTGEVQIKAGNLGGDVRSTETQEYTWVFQDKPTIVATPAP